PTTISFHGIRRLTLLPPSPSVLTMNMASLLRSALWWRGIAAGAQAERRGGAGPVRGLLGGKDLTGRFSSVAGCRNVPIQEWPLTSLLPGRLFRGLRLSFQLLAPLRRFLRLVPGVIEPHQSLGGRGQPQPGIRRDLGRTLLHALVALNQQRLRVG